MKPNFSVLLVAGLAATALTQIAPAQTATWTGFGNLATMVDWNDPANWDTGIAPNGATFTAVINQATPAYRNFPDGPYVNANPSAPATVSGGALAVISGTVTLDTLRFDLSAANSPATAALYLGQPGGGTTGSLRLTGAGLDLRSPGGTIPVDLNVAPGSSLILAAHSRVVRTGTNPLNVYLSDSTATPANPARLLVQDDASLDPGGTRWLTIYGRGAAAIVFQDRARAGLANFQLGNQTTVEFHNSASADQASFRLGNDNLVLFDGTSTAGTSSFYAAGNSFDPNAVIIRFAGQSSADHATISTGNYRIATLEFTEQATGGTATFFGLRLDISGAETGTGSTGRQRASSSALAPTSITASDTRTISLDHVRAVDVLLGSNLLEVASGSINNLRDSGGAYLSATGENLVGGGLIKTGPGTLQLLSPLPDPANGYQPSYNVISGPTVVRGGTLSLYNRLADVTVESAGTLAGRGIISGNLVNQGRITGLPAVQGDFTQSASGDFAPYYSSSLDSLQPLIVTGHATLDGTVSAAIHPNLFSQWTPGVLEFPVLTAGSLSGRFAALDTTANPARIHVETVYATTSASLRFELLPFAALGSTPGAAAYGAYLDQRYQYTGNYFPNNSNWLGDALTFATDGPAVAATLAELGPDRYGAVLAQDFATALARATTRDRLTGGNTVRTDRASHPALFAEGTRRTLTYSAVDGLPRADATTTGWLAGGRAQHGAWTAGIYVAREQSDLVQTDGSGRDRSRTTEPGAFLRYDHDAWFAHAGVGVARDQHTLTRISGFTADFVHTATHTAAPDGRRTDFSLTAGRTWQGRSWSLSPFAGLLISRWQLDDFVESSDRTGFPYDSLAVAGWSRDSRRLRAGLEASATWGRVHPRLTASWWHETDTDRSIPTRLADVTTTYAAPGRPADQDAWQLAFELDVHLGHGAWLTLGTSVQQGDFTRTASDFTAGFRWAF